MRTYLHRLFKHHLGLGLVVSSFVGLSLFFNLIGDQVTPFFVWGMFSQPELPKPTQAVWQFLADGEEVNYSCFEVGNMERFYLLTPLEKLKAMKDANGQHPTRLFLKEKLGAQYATVAPIVERITNDETDYVAFGEWLKRYTSSVVGKPIEQLEIRILECQFMPDGRVQPLSSSPFLQL
jgi:hypothetical protein